MMNPFVFGPYPKSVKDFQAANDEQNAQEAGRVISRHTLTLRLGRLLIRMGNKLTCGDPLQYKSGHLVS